MYYIVDIKDLDHVNDKIHKLENLLVAKISPSIGISHLDKLTVFDWTLIYPVDEILNKYKNLEIDDENFKFLYKRQLNKMWPSICFLFGNFYGHNVLFLIDKSSNKVDRLIYETLSRFLDIHAFPLNDISVD